MFNRNHLQLLAELFFFGCLTFCIVSFVFTDKQEKGYKQCTQWVSVNRIPVSVTLSVCLSFGLSPSVSLSLSLSLSGRLVLELTQQGFSSALAESSKANLSLQPIIPSANLERNDSWSHSCCICARTGCVLLLYRYVQSHWQMFGGRGGKQKCSIQVSHFFRGEHEHMFPLCGRQMDVKGTGLKPFLDPATFPCLVAIAIWSHLVTIQQAKSMCPIAAWLCTAGLLVRASSWLRHTAASLLIPHWATERNNTGSHLFQSEIITHMKSNKLCSAQ